MNKAIIIYIALAVILIAVFSIVYNEFSMQNTGQIVTTTNTVTNLITTTIPANSTYVEQKILAFIGNTPIINFVVTATPQNDSSATLISYFINGLSNKGDWYQLGIAIIPTGNETPFIAFQAHSKERGVYLTPKGYNTSLKIYPSSPIHYYDKIRLSMFFMNNYTIFLYANDLNSNSQEIGAYNIISNSWENGTQVQRNPSTFFIGNATILNKTTFFTGVMTEAHYSNQFLKGGHIPVDYLPINIGNLTYNSIIIGVDEQAYYHNASHVYNIDNRYVILYNRTHYDFPFMNDSVSFSENGTITMR